MVGGAVPVTTTTEGWSDWKRTIREVFKLPGAITNLPCPHCGHKELLVRFRADADRLGYGAMWCGHCNHGVVLSRVNVPQGFDIIPMDVPDNIPNFIRVGRGDDDAVVTRQF